MEHKQSDSAVQSLVVGVEANIAAGKSFLGRTLHGTSFTPPGTKTALTIQTQLECIQPDYLKLFLEDPRRHSFGLQMLTLEGRLNAIRYALHATGTPTLHLLDRSCLGDVIFATMHYLNGNISEQELAVYTGEAHRKSLGSFLFQRMDGMLYLHTSPSRCKDSLCKRDDIDKGTDLGYLVTLDLLHHYALFKVLLDYPRLRVAVADWEHYGKPADALSRVFTHPASLTWGTVTEYQEQIKAGTAAVLGDGKELGAEVKTVLMPFDVDLEPLEEKVLPAVPSGPGRRIHSGAWRAAVLRHLAQDRAVVLVGERVPCLMDVFDAVLKAL